MSIYTINKNFHNVWRAETKVMITDTIELSIVTTKRITGQLVTTATCGHVENGFVSHTVFQDYNTILDRSYPKRITKKLVEEQHLKVYLPYVRKCVLAHYNLEVELA